MYLNDLPATKKTLVLFDLESFGKGLPNNKLTSK